MKNAEQLRLEVLVRFLLPGLATLAGAPAARAATIEIAYPSLERIIVENVMTDGGRYYMQGDASTPCRYAFVQEPRVSASEGRLVVTVLFSGKAAAQIGDQCVGPGDNFDVRVSGKPAFAGGEIYLTDVSVESPNRGYFNVVSGLIRARLEERLRVPLKQAVEFLAASSAASGIGRLSVDSIRVDEIEPRADAVRLSLDFTATLRP